MQMLHNKICSEARALKKMWKKIMGVEKDEGEGNKQMENEVGKTFCWRFT